MQRPSRRKKPYNVTLEPHLAEMLRRYGEGCLSQGIRNAAQARSVVQYGHMMDAFRGLVDAHDCGEPLDPHIDNLVDLLRVSRPPGKWDRR
jgi:hypothetical protein